MNPNNNKNKLIRPQALHTVRESISSRTIISRSEVVAERVHSHTATFIAISEGRWIVTGHVHGRHGTIIVRIEVEHFCGVKDFDQGGKNGDGGVKGGKGIKLENS